MASESASRPRLREVPLQADLTGLMAPDQPAPQKTQESTDVPTSKVQVAQDAAFSVILLALKTLSQRTVVALASLVSLLVASSVFVIWFAVIENPTQLKLIGAGLYSAFALVWEWVRAK